MRILHVIPYFAPAFSYGGPPRSVLGLCNAQQRCGAEVEVYATTANGGSTDFPPEVAAARSYEGLPVRYFSRVFPKRFFRSPALKSAIAESAIQFDLVHIHGIWNWVEWNTVRECLRHGVPYVISPRGMLEQAARNHRSLRKTFAYPLIEQRNLRGAAFLHATSSGEVETLQSLNLNRPVFLLPNAVDTVPDRHALSGKFRTSLGLDAGTPLITWLGRIHPIKRLDLLATAFQRVAQTINAHLVIAGPAEGTYRREIEHLLRSHEKRVHWLGEVGGQRKAELLADTDVLVMCSSSESFGMSVVEAMAAGCAVVATRTCPWQEIEAEGCGRWVEHDADAIANALDNLLGDQQIAARMGRNGQQLVRARYTWDSVAKSMLKYYEQVFTTDRELIHA